MTAGAWAVLLATWVVAVASPGPDFLAVLRRTLDRGLAAGFRVGVGVACGIATWLCLALLGVVGLVARHQVLFDVVRLAGAVFLVLYGLSILRALWKARRQRRRAMTASRQVIGTVGPTGEPEDRPEGAACGGASVGVKEPAAPRRRAGSRWSDWRLGYLTNTIGNPKAVVFFGALFASILPSHISVGESVSVGVVMAIIALANFTVLALLSSRGPIIRGYQRAQPVIDTVLGVLFVVLGLLLIPWTGV